MSIILGVLGLGLLFSIGAYLYEGIHKLMNGGIGMDERRMFVIPKDKPLSEENIIVLRSIGISNGLIEHREDYKIKYYDRENILYYFWNQGEALTFIEEHGGYIAPLPSVWEKDN